MKRFFTLCFPVLTLILELLPWGVQMNFANPEGPPHTVFCSYFDLLPFGYADFFPMLVAVLSCVLLLVLAFYGILGNRGPLIAGLIIACLALLFSLCQLLLFPVTVIGVFVTLFLAAEAIYLGLPLRNHEV